jgi:aspartyl-tRNA(Asn)/glutamyl-tRNA(Gln) amidotransferase subunit B
MIWETVIGLEVHVQLATQSKMFCGCSAAFGDRANTNVCPVCLGLPGALPVANLEAVRLAARAAFALEFTIHPTSVFARKNYFYPDLPKGYQISQFDKPLATHGRLTIGSSDRDDVSIRMARLHLEEDAGKSLHDRFVGKTALDFNRSGVPLAEIVSEPDLRSPGEARAYLVALKQVLQYLEVSDCSMEEGSLRVDANLSVRRAGDSTLGVKQEVKNMNSFAAVERALEQMRDSQIALLEVDEAVELATFSAATGELRMMRTKEESHDYRYFPEPDLPPLALAEDWIDGERTTLPELPRAKRRRFQQAYGQRPYDAEVLTATRAVGDYFEEVVSTGAASQAATKWVMGSVLQDANANDGALRIDPRRLAALIGMVARGDLSEQAAKRVFAELPATDDEPEAVAQRLGLLQVSDRRRITEWVNTVLSVHPEEVARYHEGDHKLVGFFMGKVMQESGGKADPKKVRAVLVERLSQME